MNWDEYFFEMISLIAKKSKDPSTKVGCVIVGPDHEVRTTGFNGFPRGVWDDPDDPANKKRYERPEKYMWTEHSERNVIYNSARCGISLKGCIIYQDWYPCCDCARAIIQSGIVEVVINGRSYKEKNEEWNKRWGEQIQVAKEMLKEANVNLRVAFK